MSTQQQVVRIGSFCALALLLVAAPALAGDRVERELALDPGGRLVVETDGGSITVTGGNRSGARVVITARDEEDLDRYKLSFEESPEGLRVVARRKGGISSWFGSSGRGLQIEVEVPAETDIDLDTSGGGLRVESIRGDVKADTSGGSIRVGDVEGDVKVHTSGGGIRIADVRGDVRAETSGGGVRIENVTGSIDANSSGGPIEASFAPGAEARGRLSTSGGGVKVWLDRNANVEIDASTSGGRVSCDLPITIQGRMSESRLKGTIGSGGPRLTLRSSGGSIRIGERSI